MKYFLKMSIALAVAMIVLLSSSDVLAQRTASVSGLWSSTTTWGGQPVPTVSDAVTINNNITVFVDVTAQCASLQINGGNLPSSVILSGSNNLSVAGGININKGTALSANKTIDVAGGSLTCSSVTMETTGNNNRVSYISIGAGSVTVTGDINMGANALRNYISFTGSGVLNLGGNINGGDIIPGTGTVNFNGSAAQTVKMNNIYVYNNIYLNNLASATLSAAVSATRVLGDIRVQSGVFSNNGFNIVGNAGKTFEIANGATLQLGGASTTFPTIFTPLLGATSTVEYMGTGNQTINDIEAPGYGNLILSGGGIKAVEVEALPNPGGLDIRGDITLSSGISFNTRNYLHNIQGNWFNDGGTVTGNSTINFNGSSQAIEGAASTQSFSKISLDNNTTLYLNCESITINSTTTINAGCKLIIPAGNQVTASGNIINNAGTDGLLIISDAGGSGSLIHPNAGVPATVQRYIDPANWSTWDDGWHFLSSPVESQAINSAGGFVTSGPTTDDYDFYAWHEPELVNPWINFKNTTTPPTFSTVNPGTDFVVGRGYLVAYPPAGTKVISGDLNASNVLKNQLKRTAGSPNPGFHLLGNPYASAIAWYSGWTNNNVSAVCHVWDGITNSYSPLVAGEIIPAMNGFMVEALVNNASITIPKVSRVHDNSILWYKSASTPNTIKLIAWEESGNRGKASIIKLDPNSTTAFDAEFDGHFLSDKAPKFYSLAGDDHLSLNTLPELGGDIRIPFAFAKNDGTNFYIQLDTEKTIPDLEIYLTDTKTGIETNLSQDKVYEFSSADGDDINRFVLHFLSTTGIAPGKVAGKMQVYVAGNNLNINQSEAQSGKVYLFSITGKMIGTYALENSTSQSIGLPKLSPGIYLVNVHTSSGNYNQKVVIR